MANVWDVTSEIRLQRERLPSCLPSLALFACFDGSQLPCCKLPRPCARDRERLPVSSQRGARDLSPVAREDLGPANSHALRSAACPPSVEPSDDTLADTVLAACENP